MKNFINKTLNHIASLRVTGALNREQKGRSLFVFHNPRRVFRAALLSKLGLACLLTALLALPHCENDDNGGGGGEDSLDAIYLWVTGCTVLGNMNGGDCPALPAGAPTDGLTRADAICANRYETDVDETSRNRIAEEGEPRHRAMLVRSNDPPKEVFPVRGKDTLEIKRPDETLIADSWDQFFDPSATISDSIAGSGSVSYWTGWWVSADLYTPKASMDRVRCCSSDPLSYSSSDYDDKCWKDGSSGGPLGTIGESNSVGVTRIAEPDMAMAARVCNNTYRILCITH